MDENTVRVDEIEEYDQDEIEVDEVPEGTSAGGAFIAGIVGGFVAYAAIGGAKKLVAFAQTKLTARKLKQKETNRTVIDADFAEISGEQEETEGESSEEK